MAVFGILREKKPFCRAIHCKNVKKTQVQRWRQGLNLQLWPTLRNGYQSHFHLEFLVNVSVSSRRPPTYRIKDDQDQIIRDKIYRQVLIKVIYTLELFTVDLVSNASTDFFQDSTLSSIEKVLPEQLKLEGQWGVAISKKSYPSMYQVVTEGKFMFFDLKTFQSRLFFTICNTVSNLPVRIRLKP